VVSSVPERPAVGGVGRRFGDTAIVGKVSVLKRYVPLGLPRGLVRHERAGIEILTTERYPIAMMGIRLRFGLPAASAIATYRETASSTTHA
jgi:hypothetical protein